MLGPNARQIRQMFSLIAPRYDLLNHLLSLNIDKSWRRQAVQLLRDAAARPQALCLDLCSGTGDVCLEMLQQGVSRVVASDFSHSMLRLNQQKLRRRAVANQVTLIEADALNLPLPSNLFDAVIVAFGLRNLEDREKGLLEIQRVLKPAGQLAVLEFSKPTNAIFDVVFRFYFFKVLPRIGALISGHAQAYSYLPRSVSGFPDQGQLARTFRECGFVKVGYLNLSGGIAAIHYGSKACTA
jgi:demethylmenaquinone methyltransferase/2-methoxy-6-polyprenyl-1,4-benzoquinol methylase